MRTRIVRSTLRYAPATRRSASGVTERRNVRADFRELFGESVRYVDAVAIMTDTDNTGGTAVAYYGDITFSSE